MAHQERFVVFISLQHKDNPSIQGKNFSPCENIPPVDEIFVPGKTKDDPGENKLIVYQPGNKTIFTDKSLGEIRESKDFSQEPINLIDGHLFVDKREILLITYLRASNYNLTNENRMPDKLPIFRERDKAQDAEEFLEEDFKIHQIKTRIHSGYDPDELEAIAMILGDTNADQKSTNEVRRDLLVFCKNQPERLIEAMETPENARKVYIIRAFKNKIVHHDSKVNEIKWVGGGKICDVPMGQNPEDYLLLLTGQDAFTELLDNIKDRLPKSATFKVVDKEEENQPPPPQPEAPAQPPASAEAGIAPAAEPPPAGGAPDPDPPADFDAKAYILKAVECGAMFKAGPYFCLKGAKKGDKYHSLGNSYQKVGDLILSTPELWTLIESEMFVEGAQ